MAKDKRQMLVKIGDSTFDKISAYYNDPEHYPLSESVNEIRERWVLVVNLLLKKFPKFKIANMLVRDHGLSQAQAYIDIRNSESLFGSVFKTEKAAEKAMWKEWVKDALLRAIRNRDSKAEMKALDLLAKYGDLDEKDLEFNPEKLENVEIQFAIAKKYLELLKQSDKTGVADFNRTEALDIDFEDVQDAES
ncbi:hypothetical protein LXD69_10160 [Flavobacterium sediminilitoris]|uniref:Uncharacterized protein n=1 Tax=Flavobacterium sediminilitoris TaxID=2024526 RepID=A0ABY4HHW1_9FLAO|nr:MULTISPECIES: hypothetical protein [Flavobacterium]UOX32415.1 hypothetical protein LXD69_10160 [Flavobacterium sediminilitoris]